MTNEKVDGNSAVLAVTSYPGSDKDSRYTRVTLKLVDDTWLIDNANELI